MELLMNTQKECQQLEVYGEYLKKIPELLKQLETVEKMYQKAVLEEAMLKDKPLDNHSVQLYAERLRRIKEQSRPPVQRVVCSRAISPCY